MAGEHGGGHLARAHAMVYASGQVHGCHNKILNIKHKYTYIHASTIIAWEDSYWKESVSEYTCVGLYVYTYVCMHEYINACASMYVCMYVRMYLFMYSTYCTYVCMGVLPANLHSNPNTLCHR